MDFTILAIDPGLNGALVELRPDGVCHGFKMPLIKREMDIIGVRKIIEAVKSGDYTIEAFLEKQLALPGFAGGKKQMDNYGALRGLCCGLYVSMHEVDTKDWQKDIFGDRLNDPEFKKYNAREKKKVKMIWGAKILAVKLPAFDHQYNEGLIDAGLMAVWARDHYEPED